MMCKEVPLNLAECIARVIVRSSMSETGRAAIGWNLLLELFKVLDKPALQLELYSALLQNIYIVVHNEQLEGQLKSIARGVSANLASVYESRRGINSLNINGDNNNVDVIDDLPIKINELIHFLRLVLTEELHPLITEKYGKLPPPQTLVDFCFLVNKMFEFQMKSLTDQCALRLKSDNETRRDIWERTRVLRGWFEVISVLCEICMKIIPNVTNLLISSDEALDSHGWLPSADHQIRNSIVNAQLNESGIYSPASLNTLYEALLTRLKVLCIDDGLPANVRSIAVDTLLCAAMQPAVCKLVNNNPYETSDSEALDDDNVRADYEKFLVLSGQS